MITAFKSACTFALFLGLAGAAFAQAPGPPKPIVFAASTLQSALDPIAAAWTASTGKTLAVTYDASGVLAKKIEAGAPLDLLIADDRKTMDGLGKAGLINTHTRRNIIGIDLVLIAPVASKAKLKIVTGFDLAGAVGAGKLAVCAIETCPAGVDAKQALETLKIWSAVQPKLALGDTDAAAVGMVARGEASYGIVFATDAKGEPKVKIVDTFPASMHDPIVFPIAMAKDSKNPDAALFAAYMRSGEATRILLGLGFSVLK